MGKLSREGCAPRVGHWLLNRRPSRSSPRSRPPTAAKPTGYRPISEPRPRLASMSRNQGSHPSARLIVIAVLAISALPVPQSGRRLGRRPRHSQCGYSAPGLASGLALHPSRGRLDRFPGRSLSLHASGGYKFRYQYLCGGVNTGTGWATWNAGAKFADYYVDESVAAGITPVFIYYQLLQSSPAGGDEGTADRSNLKNNSTMSSYWSDVTSCSRTWAPTRRRSSSISNPICGLHPASLHRRQRRIGAGICREQRQPRPGRPAEQRSRLRSGLRPSPRQVRSERHLGYELSMWGR